MESLTYGEPEPVCRVKLLREKTRQIGKMALTYRMYEVAVGEHSAYAVGAALKGGEGEENTPLFLYDHCSARAEAFFFICWRPAFFPAPSAMCWRMCAAIFHLFPWENLRISLYKFLKIWYDKA